MDDVKHSELPWFVHDFTGTEVTDSPRSDDVTVSCDHPATITVAVMGRALTATLEEARANAAFIVQACNNFESLLAALKAVGWVCDDPNGSESATGLASALLECLPAARAAIKSAEQR